MVRMLFPGCVVAKSAVLYSVKCDYPMQWLLDYWALQKLPPSISCPAFLAIDFGSGSESGPVSGNFPA